jgi:hypothetical protein
MTHMAAGKLMRITFDTNVLADVVSPETSQRPTGCANGTMVRSALRSGYIQGMFCETLVTLEGIKNADRTAVFGSTSVRANYRHEIAPDGNGVTHIDLRAEQEARRALDQRQADRFLAAFDLGMKLLNVPRVGTVGIDDPEGTRYLAERDEGQLARRLERYFNVVTAIEARGLGCAQAQRIAREIQSAVGGHRPFAFYLGSPRNQAERKRINRAIAEWADGDSVAAHYSYNIDLFCSEDFGMNAPSASTLDNANRRWLTDEFGIRFVTLDELANIVAT